MRVAIDARKLHDFGIGTYIRNLLRHLARIDQTSEYVLLCAAADMDVAPTLGPNFRTVLEPSPNYSLREQWHVPIVLRRERPDVYHSPHYVLPAAVMSPSVVTIHDCIHLMFPQYLPNRRSYLYARTMMWAAAKRADAILTVSEASKRDILRFFDVKPEKVVVVHNAIDEIRRGDFEEMKLLILGDEISKMPALRRAVHQHHLHKHVRFLGYVADETLASLYRLAAVFVFPSIYEGFGLPPLEAMACGAPVVTSNVSSLPEVTGDAAVLVDPHDTSSIVQGVRRVLSDPVFANQLRQRGPVRARQFSWERSVAKTRDLYERVASGRWQAGSGAS